MRHARSVLPFSGAIQAPIQRYECLLVALAFAVVVLGRHGTATRSCSAPPCRLRAIPNEEKKDDS